MCVALFHGETGHRDQVLSVAFNVDGNRFASSGMDHSLKVWSLDKEEIRLTLKRAEEATAESLALR